QCAGGRENGVVSAVTPEWCLARPEARPNRSRSTSPSSPTALTTWLRISNSPAFEATRTWDETCQPSIVMVVEPKQVSRRRAPVASSATIRSCDPMRQDTNAPRDTSGESRGDRSGTWYKDSHQARPLEEGNSQTSSSEVKVMRSARKWG